MKTDDARRPRRLEISSPIRASPSGTDITNRAAPCTSGTGETSPSGTGSADQSIGDWHSWPSGPLRIGHRGNQSIGDWNSWRRVKKKRWVGAHHIGAKRRQPRVGPMTEACWWVTEKKAHVKELSLYRRITYALYYTPIIVHLNSFIDK